MNSREIVRRTLDFDNPSRVARSFADSDFVGCRCEAPTAATEWRDVGGGRWERLDEWGNLWARVDSSSKGEVVRGVLDELSAVETLELPDMSGPQYYEEAARRRREHPHKWLQGGLPGFAFSVARKMRRLDQYLIDLLLEPQRIGQLHDRIDDLLADMIVNYARIGADSVGFAEDWGTQMQTLVSPDLWRREFFPRFCRLCGLAHEHGLKVVMHSCGRIEAIVPGLIEAGVDALQFDQPELHGIDKLASYQEKACITFHCPVDIQRTLQSGDEKLIRSAAREMLQKLWRGRGGFIAGYYGDNSSIGVDPAWQQYACEEFLCSGVQPESC